MGDWKKSVAEQVRKSPKVKAAGIEKMARTVACTKCGGTLKPTPTKESDLACTACGATVGITSVTVR